MKIRNITIVGYCIVSIIVCLHSKLTQASSEWTWVYSRTLHLKDYKKYMQDNELVISSKEVKRFSQLMFSWNAFRPEEGYFSFDIRVRDASTKEWGEWHHMIDWGKGVQVSYAKHDGTLAKYLHVRLEMHHSKLADAFSVRIKAYQGAPIQKMQSFTVVASDYSLFKSETVAQIHSHNLSSIVIENVPRISQFALNHHASDRICSPTSCSMLMQYLTGNTIDSSTFADNVYDSGLDAYGSWPFNTAHAFEYTQGLIRMFPARLNSFVDLHKQLLRGIPVVVSVRGFLPGAVKAFNSGHLMIVVGYNACNKEVICHDPAFKDHKETRVSYPLKDFIAAWELSRRFVYWAEPLAQV